MVVHPYWINDRLAIVPRPRGGDWLDDEMLALRQAGIGVVVSMLEESEADELGLSSEKTAASNASLQFMNFAVSDRSVPTHVAHFHKFLDSLDEQMQKGSAVGVHCRACIGRASILAASLLIRSGTPPSRAWQEIETARGFHVPDTPEQREWVDANVRIRP